MAWLRVCGRMLPACAVFGVATTAYAAAEPTKGLYREDQYVASATTSPAGLSGCDTVGDTLGGTFLFNGPAAAGSKSYGTYETGSENYIGICSFPVAPASGVTTWSGTYPCTNYPFSGTTSTYTTTFVWTIKYIDANSFIADKTLSFPIPGGTCSVARHAAFTRSGK